MRTDPRNYQVSNWLLRFLLPLTIIFYSCESYNFSQPQPADKSSVYEFPAEFAGTWIDDDSEKLVIEKDFIGLVIAENQNVAGGIWPKKDGLGGFVYPPAGYFSEYTLLTDSLQRPTDTVKNYFINGEYIYEVLDKGLLGKGFPYKRSGDSFNVSKDDTIFVDLGRNAFLRDIGDGFLVLNILNPPLDDDKRWWQLFLLEKKGNDRINVWFCSSPLTRQPSMFYEVRGNHYFNSQWSAMEMLKLIRQGAFEMCNQLRRQQ